MSNDVHVPGLAEVSEDACYRAMDWLPEVEPTLAKNVYDSVADSFNLEVDLLFFDTTSTHFRIEQADTPVPRDEHGDRIGNTDDAANEVGFRTWGRGVAHLPLPSQRAPLGQGVTEPAELERLQRSHQVGPDRIERPGCRGCGGHRVVSWSGLRGASAPPGMRVSWTLPGVVVRPEYSLA